MKNKKNFGIFGFSLIVLLNSCSVYDGYYNKVKNNIDEFSSTVKYIESNRMFEVKDSIIKKRSNIPFNNVSLYENDIKDSILVAFMKKFNIDKITLEKRNDNFYNNVISFHKDYNPITGSSKTVDFDFGISPLRHRIEQGIKKERGYLLKIINADFIYSVNKNPSFGE